MRWPWGRRRWTGSWSPFRAGKADSRSVPPSAAARKLSFGHAPESFRWGLDAGTPAATRAVTRAGGSSTFLERAKQGVHDGGADVRPLVITFLNPRASLLHAF